MIHPGLPLLAADLTRIRFQWGRIQTNSDWILPILVCLAVMLFVRAMYRRDAAELHPWLGWLLTGLRSVAVLGLLVLYLQPQWRVEREVVENSRVLVLADTSLSMGLSDTDTSVAPDSSSRARRVAAALEQTAFLDKLRATHDVVVMRFDEAVSRIASLAKLGPADNASSEGLPADAPDDAPDDAAALTPTRQLTAHGSTIDWPQALRPSGKETRLGQALRQVLTEERGTPVSGVVVVTDGGQNAGPSVDAAIELASEARIPIFPVGVGSTERPTNVRVYELEAPERAHPGDPYAVTGLIQAEGMSGKSVNVQLAVRDPASGAEQVAETQQVTLGRDGDTVAVRFQLTPTETGRRQLILRVATARPDRNPNDDQREADVEIVDRRNRVLLVAGGPSREYQFLKSLLYRDKSSTVDVLLQTGAEGVSQEANKLLDEFPSTREEMYAYDAVAAFDPQWTALLASQVDLLESWVAEQGGGLIVIPGPVHAGQAVNSWIQAPTLDKFRALYPVEFHRRVSVVDAGAFLGKEPAPLDFTREGREAEFLWLAGEDLASQQAWASFPGVYGHFPIRGVKPGATVYARFASAQAGATGEQPPYFVGQFYGSGRVFLSRQRRDVAPSRIGEGLLRAVLHATLAPRFPGQIAPPVEPRHARARQGPLPAGQHRSDSRPAYQCPVAAADRHQRAGGSDSARPRRRNPFAATRSQPRRDVHRPAHGASGGSLPPGVAGARQRRTPLAASPGPRAGPGTREPAAQRRAAQPHRRRIGRKVLQRPGRSLARDAADPLLAHLKDRTKTSILASAPNPLWERSWLRAMMLALSAVLCLEWLLRRLFKLA